MNKKVLSILLIVMVFLVGCANQEKLSSEDLEKYSALSQSAIENVANSDYDSFIGMCNDTMKNGIDEGQFKEITNLVNEKGEIVEFKEKDGIIMKDKSSGESIKTIIQKVAQKDGESTYTISFNENDELSGFYVK